MAHRYEWIKRAEVPLAARRNYVAIWDSEPADFQINQCQEDGNKFILMDVLMPHWVPASRVLASFSTLEDAQAMAAKLGPQDWSGFSSDLLET